MKDSIRFGSIAIFVFAIGALGLLSGDIMSADPDPEALVEDVLTEQDEFETIEGTRTVEQEIDGVGDDHPRKTKRTEDIWLRPPDQKRTEVTATHNLPVESAGDIRAVNGSTSYLYTSELEQMLVDTEHDGDVDPFVVSNMTDQYDVEYLGTDSIADRNTIRK